VEDELSAGIAPVELLPEPDRAGAEARVRRLYEQARGAYVASRALPAEALKDVAGVAGELAALATGATGTTVVLHDIAPADRWAHRHPVNRTAVGLLLAAELFRRHGWVDSTGARRFDRIDERLALLGVGLLLADIGNVAVPAEVLNRPGAPSDSEWAQIRRHPEVGAALLPPRSTSPRVADVVADHHERLHGGGYPRGLRAGEIHQFAAIAAVADVFAAATVERPYRPALPASAGVAIVLDGAGNAFDREVVDVFRRVVVPHPPGTELTLADGRAGVVAAVAPGAPYMPLVRLPDGERRVDARTARA
jgi:HD-GYP domain-containing protein (c-di-GMP phosphodiesterase class II)